MSKAGHETTTPSCVGEQTATRRHSALRGVLVPSRGLFSGTLAVQPHVPLYHRDRVHNSHISNRIVPILSFAPISSIVTLYLGFLSSHSRFFATRLVALLRDSHTTHCLALVPTKSIPVLAVSPSQQSLRQCACPTPKTMTAGRATATDKSDYTDPPPTPARCC